MNGLEDVATGGRSFSNRELDFGQLEMSVGQQCQPVFYPSLMQ